MSSTLIETTTPVDDPARLDIVDADWREAKPNPSPWRWMVLTCLLLGISGGVRSYRDHQFAKLSSELKECPFPLADIGSSLGSWRTVENSDTKLDPEIARIAGSSDHIVRSYIDSRSGETIHVMMLYGLAQDIFAHTPEICYPASGYLSVGPPKDRGIPISSESKISEPVRFRTQVFHRTAGPGMDQYTESAYSFRLGDTHEGMWRPDMASEWKSFRRQPGMFKIQMSREVSAAAANPDAPQSKTCESLMTELIKEIEHRLALSMASVK
jgi:hypothetical protein